MSNVCFFLIADGFNKTFLDCKSLAQKKKS